MTFRAWHTLYDSDQACARTLQRGLLCLGPHAKRQHTMLLTGRFRKFALDGQS